MPHRPARRIPDPGRFDPDPRHQPRPGARNRRSRGRRPRSLRPSPGVALRRRHRPQSRIRPRRRRGRAHPGGLALRLFERPGLCTMKTTTDLLRLPGPYGFKWPKLDELHAFLFGGPTRAPTTRPATSRPAPAASSSCGAAATTRGPDRCETRGRPLIDDRKIRPFRGQDPVLRADDVHLDVEGARMGRLNIDDREGIGALVAQDDRVAPAERRSWCPSR